MKVLHALAQSCLMLIMFCHTAAFAGGPAHPAKPQNAIHLYARRRLLLF